MTLSTTRRWSSRAMWEAWLFLVCIGVGITIASSNAHISFLYVSSMRHEYRCKHFVRVYWRKVGLWPRLPMFTTSWIREPCLWMFLLLLLSHPWLFPEASQLLISRTTVLHVLRINGLGLANDCPRVKAVPQRYFQYHVFVKTIRWVEEDNS